MNEIQKLIQVKKIINKYFKVLESLPYGRPIDKEVALQLGIPQELIPIINNAYKKGRVQARKGENLPNHEIEKEIQKEKVSKSLIRLQEEKAKEDLSNLLAKTRTKLTRQATDYLKADLGVINTVFKDEPIPTNWIAQELRKITQDSRQDWDMVIRSELMNNRLEGEAEKILSGESAFSNDRENTKVYKRPNPDACKHCKRLYLENNSKRPKVFTLGELMANGNNIGLKVADWKPTLGIIHPHCQCSLQILPDGMTLDELGNMVKEKGGVNGI